jgi:uncharacterized protein
VSQENVEAAQQAIAAFNRGDIEVAFDSVHPEIEWVVTKEHPNAATLHGREAVAAYFQDWRETLDEMRFDMDRIVDAGDTVVTVGTVRGVGIGSGAEVEIPIAFVSILRGGKTIRVEEYLNPAEALEAVELRE